MDPGAVTHPSPRSRDALPLGLLRSQGPRRAGTPLGLEPIEHVVTTRSAAAPAPCWFRGRRSSGDDGEPAGRCYFDVTRSRPASFDPIVRLHQVIAEVGRAPYT
jgi:hypothetical protein